MWRSLTLLLVPCLACGPGASTSARDVGLLVGLSSGRTLWIAARDGRVQLVAEKPHLLVPRDSGFWWVGTVERCTVEEYDGGGMNIDGGVFIGREEQVFIAREGEPATVMLDGTGCAEAEAAAAGLRFAKAGDVLDSLGAAGDTITTLHDLGIDTTISGLSHGMECSIRTRTVTFVADSVLAVEERYHVTEYCSPAKYYTDGSNRVTTLDGGEPIALRPHLSAAQWSALVERFSTDADCGFTDHLAGDQFVGAWTVHRRRGTWVADLWIEGSIACRGGSESELGLPLPASFTGGAPLPVAWDRIAERFPDLRDASSPPSGDVLAVLGQDTLSIVRTRGRRLGDVLGTVPIGVQEAIVMIRWASPAEAAAWNRRIPTLAPPDVRVRPDSSR